MILTGHHRSAAALLRGWPVWARLVGGDAVAVMHRSVTAALHIGAASPARPALGVDRVAAARVLVAADVDPADAVAKVVAARPVGIDAWCRPRVVVIHTVGCGDDHYVRIERGLPPERHRCRPSARDRGEVVFRVSSSATCEEAVACWRTANVGGVQVDLTEGPTPRYHRIGHDPGVFGAQRIFVAATLAKARGAFLEAGEPDRWLVFEGLPSPLGTPALLHASTRPIAMALVTAPPTWLWSTEPLT